MSEIFVLVVPNKTPFGTITWFWFVGKWEKSIRCFIALFCVRSKRLGRLEAKVTGSYHHREHALYLSRITVIKGGKRITTDLRDIHMS